VYLHCNADSILFAFRAGVVTAEDGELYLPPVATQQDIIQCLATGAFKRSVAADGRCKAGGRWIKLWELHNVIVSLGGYDKVTNSCNPATNIRRARKK
jgi:hypothetical protein